MTPLPPGPYSVILADPPWTFKRRGKATAGDRNPDRHYPTMKLADIKALPVGDVAAPDSWLFLWTSGPWLPHALEVVQAWGFAYATRAFTWVKLIPSQATQAFVTERDFHLGCGYTTRANTEFVILGRRGRPQRMARDVRELVVAARREHSRKPDEVRRRIERLAGDVPRLELFSRESAPGWDAWGLEAGKFDRACGTCVVWNGSPGHAEGACSVHGMRPATAQACERWFPTDELNAALYGRKSA